MQGVGIISLVWKAMLSLIGSNFHVGFFFRSFIIVLRCRVFFSSQKMISFCLEKSELTLMLCLRNDCNSAQDPECEPLSQPPISDLNSVAPD